MAPFTVTISAIYVQPCVRVRISQAVRPLPKIPYWSRALFYQQSQSAVAS